LLFDDSFEQLKRKEKGARGEDGADSPRWPVCGASAIPVDDNMHEARFHFYISALLRRFRKIHSTASRNKMQHDAILNIVLEV